LIKKLLSPFVPCSKLIALTEPELIQGCLRDDPRSQKLLYERYAGRMYSVCLRYARRSSDAADILQDGFVKVYGNLKNYRGDGSFEGWIRRIMVNTAIRMYQRHRFKFEETGIDAVWHDSKIEPDALAQLSETELLGVVGQLPEGYKLVFNLVAIEGYSHAEVADLLNIEESTSRSQLTKARRQLVRQIEEKTAFGLQKKVA
jgi:RNA polymerase sigma factor (sigma-70 family)